MTPGRLDDLLARALQTGVIPQDATDEERRELEQLVDRAKDVRLNAAVVRREAEAALPTARARFQRHLESQRPVAVAPSVAPEPKPGYLGRLLAGRRMAFGASVASLAVVAVLAIALLQPFSSPQSAAALTIDDYVQLQGVVAATDGQGGVTVQSADFGNLEVALSDLTSVFSPDGEPTTTELQPGDPVVVGGIVTAKRAIRATSVAVAENQSPPPPIERPKVRVLRDFRPIQGTITLVSLSPDGENARVLLRLGDERIFVDVEPRSVDQFFESEGTALQARVRVVEAPDLAKGVFRLQPIEQQPSATVEPGGARPQFQNVRGVILSREGNLLRVETDRGIVAVELRPTTAIRLGESGLTREAILRGETAIGHGVVISGNPGGAAGRRIVAEVLTLLPKPAQR